MSTLFSNDAGFGPRSWFALVTWLILFALGMYLYSLWQERNPVRARFFRRLGLGLSIVSGLGVVQLLLRRIGVPVVGWPIWGYVIALATLLFAGWALWFHQARLPALLGTTAGPAAGGRRPVARSGQGARTYPANGSRPVAPAAPAPPRPVATTSRREARRERKRKGR
jgi:hypothetical protein